MKKELLFIVALKGFTFMRGIGLTTIQEVSSWRKRLPKDGQTNMVLAIAKTASGS